KETIEYKQFPIELNENNIINWVNMTLYIVKNTPNNTPTYSSRGFAYIGLTMYETVVYGNPNYNTMNGILNGLNNLPKPDLTQQYNWEIALNAGQSYIISKIYDQTNSLNKAYILKLEQEILHKLSTNTNQDVIDRSIKYGILVASTIFEWSKSDGGYQAYRQNLYPYYVKPTIAGALWIAPGTDVVSSPNFQGAVVDPLRLGPLHPYWGENRNFLKTNADLKVPAPVEYSDSVNSTCYRFYKDVYDSSSNLTTDQYNIIHWWGDDPTVTITPPGHSYNIAKIIIEKENADIFKSAQTLAMVGLAVGDAFINCWKAKFTYYRPRPYYYIRNILKKSTWTNIFPEPLFPSYYSGHAVQGAAFLTVLSNVYGEKYPFTDDTHVGRNATEIERTYFVTYNFRNFTSFWQAAEEIAYSRFYGGIHTQEDNIIGSRLHTDNFIK
ncbi:MAG: vanadium-dependent haloperoxidase, partial [Sediminibacterium sp.]|nr:vanadium-dependent haloperoxidase [Sediminibacterium sp.]